MPERFLEKSNSIFTYDVHWQLKAANILKRTIVSGGSLVKMEKYRYLKTDRSLATIYNKFCSFTHVTEIEVTSLDKTQLKRTP